MTLHVLPLPPILAGSNVELWRKWWAFFCLSQEYKADLIDEYPDLVIVLPPSAQYKDGPRHRVFFNPDVFDTLVKTEHVLKFWDEIKIFNGTFPRQATPPDVNIHTLYNELHPVNRAILAYKYRYQVRPETFFFDMDFDAALKAATSLEELSKFYELYPPSWMERVL